MIIKPKRSKVAGRRPNLSNLADGELFINSTDKVIGIRAGNELVELGGNPTDLAAVATSGAYSDLIGTPTALKNPTSLTLQNSTGTSLGTYDGSEAKTIKLTATTVGLGNVTNESKATMFTNAALTGKPTAPTATAGTSSTQVATTAFVAMAIANKTSVDSATKATEDGNGNIIVNTYATKTELTDGLASKLDSTASAASASKLATARTITLGGDASGSVSFDGSENKTLTVTVKDDSHNHIISNVDGLQNALDAKLDATAKAASATVADSANAVAWGNVSGKPSSFTPSSHNQASSTINALTGYSKPSSTSALATSDTLNSALGKLEKALDGKLSTSGKAASATVADSANAVAWGSVTGKPSSFTPSSHNQASNTITAMTGYSKPSTTSAIAATDSLNAAVGKLEKALDGKASTGSVTTALSDAKSYTDTKVAALVDSSPATLDTLNELAAALGDDPNFATTVATQIGTKANSSEVVKLSGNQTIGGTKTFSSTIAGSINGNAASATKATQDASGNVITSTYATKTELNNGLAKKAEKETGVFYIEGTGDTAGTWLGSHSGITEYYAGLMIAYKPSIAGATGLTLNINNLGAVAVVRNTTTAVTTHYGVGSILMLVYTVDSNGTAYWKITDYDSDTKTRSSNKASTKMYIIGATTQSTSGQTTYSNSKCYIGTDNCLYSNGTKVASSSDITTLQAAIDDKSTVHVGSEAPEDDEVSIWIDIDEDANTNTGMDSVPKTGDRGLLAGFEEGVVYHVPAEGGEISIGPNSPDTLTIAMDPAMDANTAPGPLTLIFEPCYRASYIKHILLFYPSELVTVVMSEEGVEDGHAVYSEELFDNMSAFINDITLGSLLTRIIVSGYDLGGNFDISSDVPASVVLVSSKPFI